MENIFIEESELMRNLLAEILLKKSIDNFFRIPLHQRFKQLNKFSSTGNFWYYCAGNKRYGSSLKIYLPPRLIRIDFLEDLKINNNKIPQEVLPFFHKASKINWHMQHFVSEHTKVFV
jgi:hypothetical protein